MEIKLECPCCGSVECRSFWALVAPFLRRYALGSGAPYTAQLRECRSCGHRFFRERFTGEEMGRLYGGYRDGEYLRIRQRVEPWYTSVHNEAGLDPKVIEGRQQQLRHLLRQAGWAEGERRVVVDVGGDAGQFIPLDLASEAYVVEAHARPPVAGVQRVATLEQVPQSVGLLLCLHVLEHLPDPGAFLRGLVSSGRLADDCLVVLEVPLERPWLGPLLGTRLYRCWLQLVGRCLPLAIALDFPATVARLVLGVVVPPLFLKMHEHVGFFTAEPLLQLMQKARLSVLFVETVGGSSLLIYQGSISVVATTARAEQGRRSG